jgi:YidC/Oxa1 family membrane protein insertase
VGFFELFSGALTGFYALIPSYGLAIILLTIAVRVLLLPLSIKQTRSMREMQKIQPEVKKIQAKHKGDRQKMNEEMMALYKEHGVNPFGGCAPLLLQFPVLIGLFYVVRTPLAYMGYQAPPPIEGLPTGFFTSPIIISPVDFAARQVSGLLQTLQDSRLAHDLIEKAQDVYGFLGMKLHCSASGIISPPSESTLDKLSDASRELNVACGSGVGRAIPYLVLVLLMGLTTWYQQKQMQARQDQSSPQAAQMAMFAKIMPVMLMLFSYNFPTGVVLYWLTTNLWTIVQQRIVLAAAPPAAVGGNAKKQPPPAATTEEGAPPTKNPPKGSGTANRSKKKKR